MSDPIALDDGYHVYKLIEKADRPLDPAQVAEISATAFDDWYNPQKDDAETSGVITRDDSIQRAPPPADDRDGLDMSGPGGVCVWFTGLSGSGKSTTADAVIGLAAGSWSRGDRARR